MPEKIKLTAADRRLLWRVLAREIMRLVDSLPDEQMAKLEAVAPRYQKFSQFDHQLVTPAILRVTVDSGSIQDYLEMLRQTDQ